MSPRAVAGALGLLFLTGAIGATPAVAGMRRPVPLATQIAAADAVVLATVAAVSVTESDEVRTITLTVDVQDSLPGRPASGRLQVRVVQGGLGTSADFGTIYAASETRLFVLKRADDGVLEQQLFVAPRLSATPPAHAHPLARGGRWLAWPDWGNGGVLFPLALPLTFADLGGARKCYGSTLSTFVAWFTWEDLRDLPQRDVDVTRAQAAPPQWCDPARPFPVALRCRDEGCPPLSLPVLDTIVCEGDPGAVILTRSGPATFAVRGAIKGHRLPAKVTAVVDDEAQALRFSTPGAKGRSLLELYTPWYAVVAMVSPTGGVPPPVPVLHAEGRLLRGDPGPLLVCVAP